MKTFRALFIVVVTIAITSTAYAVAPMSLYERLGGAKGIRAVVNDFVANCAGDPRISAFFVPTAADPKRLETFKRNLANQICEASGGPCKYTGKNMRDAHANMGITDAHFDALVEDLGKSLDKFNVAGGDKAKLVGILGPMRKEIVAKPGAGAPAAH